MSNRRHIKNKAFKEPKYGVKAALLAGTLFTGTLFSMTTVMADLTTPNQDHKAKPFQLKKVTVSATRMETDLEDVTRSIDVVEQQEIATMQAKSIAEVLRYQPNVTVAGGPRTGQQSVNVRGLANEKILQTIDGIRQDFSSGHRPSYYLDPELLKQAEVIKGPVSSLWGSGAVGGVVAQSTINASDLLKPDQNLGGFVKSGYNNNNDQSVNSAALAGRTDSLDWLLSGYYRDSNDLEMGNGHDLGNSASRDYGLLAKSEWQLNDEQSVNINFRMAEVNGSVPGNGAAATSDSNFLIDRKQETSTLALGYHLNTDSPLVNTRAKVYWNSVDMDEDRVSDGRSDRTESDVLGLQLSNQSDFNGLTLLYGIDGYHEKFKVKRGGIDRPTPPKAKSDVWGAFVQATIPLAETWSLELGARFDDFSTKSDNLGIKQTENEFSPSMAISWQAADWLGLTLRYDEAFRAPGSEELYTTGTHFCIGPPFGCNSFVSNPNLKPESAKNTELLAKMRFANIFTNDELHINASVFNNKVDNFIEQTVTGPSVTLPPFGPPIPIFDAGTTTWNNVDKAELKGFEIAADYQLNHLRLKVSYGQVRGEDKKTGRDLSYIPADTFTADLSYALMNEQWLTGIRVINAATQDKTPDNQSYDGYTIGDLYLTWQPQALEGIKIGLTVNNISDRHYRRAFEELYESGREVIASVRYQF